MGNICRSPTAHAIFREQVRNVGLANSIAIDSAGTHAYHVGNPPDHRATQTASGRGVDMTDLRAREVEQSDYSAYDYIVAMDRDNLRLLQAACPADQLSRLSLMLSWGTGWGDEVPDPYYGGDEGFAQVFDMLADACQGLLKHISEKHGLLNDVS
jgi:protein-tyrosine phosphatase